MESGSHLFSRVVSNQVSSADCVLTVVFGMGTGVSHNRITTGISLSSTFKTEHMYSIIKIVFGQALGLLVSVSSTCCHAYTSDLSTS